VKALRLALVAVIAAAPAWSRQDGSFVVDESGQVFVRLGDAVRSIGNGQGTITVRPGIYGDCAVQTEGRIHYRAEIPGTAIFDGGVCEGKAVLVLRGTSARVEGLIFQNLRVADGNGAGIRLERGDLDVFNAIFRNSQEGILTAADPDGEIRIDQSTFSGLGRCDAGLACAHSIYAGYYGGLSIFRSRFERGRGGHYVKSNTARVSIADSSFDDSGGVDTNYMIDLSAGATGRIVGNSFVQGVRKENYSAMIAVAAEARAHPSAGLTITGNEVGLAPGARPTVFVVNWSGEKIAVAGNRLTGSIQPYEARR
jgi:hypothetical protein